MSEEGKIDTESAFAPIDDVIAALESLPGIDNNRGEREAARNRMDRDFQEGQ